MSKLFSSRCLICLLVACIFSVCCGAAEKQSDVDKPDRVYVDFAAQVWPVLKRRCIKCHNDEKSEGGLRLETKALVQLGGHTGNTILGETPEESELYQRIVSDDESYRMPAESSPLAAAEIQLIKRWLDEGSTWPQQQFAAGESSYSGLAKRYFDRFIMPLKREYDRNSKYLAFLGFPLVAYLVFLFVCERSRGSNSTRTWAIKLGKFHRSIHVVVLLIFSFVGLWLYHHVAMANAETRINQLSQNVSRLRGERHTSSRDRNARPVPPKRKHPKRLGGVYFRGNDERDLRLFNGGFYRTAELTVWLSDSQGRRLQWNDEVTDDSLFVSMEIRRSQNATPALFTPRVMKQIYLSRQVPKEESDEFKDVPIRFIPVEEGETWTAHYQITKSARSLIQNLKGMVYVYQGKLDGNRISGQIHYGIEYEIIISDGKVSVDSQLWMGSIFNLAGKLLIPADNRIILTEWFDFRPIPEIEGENTTDPILLGIPEHEYD